MPSIPQPLLFDLLQKFLNDPGTALLYVALILILGLSSLVLVLLVQIAQTSARIRRAKMWFAFHKLAIEHDDPKVTKLSRDLIEQDLLPRPRKNGEGAVEGFLALLARRRKPPK